MSHILDELLAQAANGSPITAALSSESVAVLFFASEFLGERKNWLDRGVDPLDDVTDADWDAIEKLVGNVFEEIMTPIDITPVGTVAMWPLATPPEKWLICNAQSLLRVDYAELFAVIGTTYGAADANHFYVPDYRDYSPMGAGTTVALAAAGGTLQQSLSVTQLPAHSHTINDPGHVHGIHLQTGGTAGANNVILAAISNVNTVPNTKNTESAATGISINNAGSGGLVNMLHPVKGVNFIIYAGT